MVASTTPLSHGWGFRLLLAPIGLLYWFWTRTLRIRAASFDDDVSLRNLANSTIIILWHNRLFVAGVWRRRFRKGRSCHGLISGSRDGAWLESFYWWSGLRTVRGSRNKRGAGALRDLARVLKNGDDVGITPDGSRGPCYEAKPGALFLAKVTKAPILLVSFEYSFATRLGSWDGFFVPMPFSKILARGKILDSKELLADQSPDEATEMLQAELMKLTKD